MGAVMQSVETNIGQLSNALKDNNKGQFLSNMEVNPKDQCNSISLKSGKQVGNEEGNRESKKSDRTEKVVVEEKKVEEKEIEPEQKPMYKPPLPYPQRFKKKTLDEKFSKFLKIFKKIHINIPFFDALEQMPNYSRIIKEVMSKKKSLQDKRANINFMSFSVYKALDLGEMKSTSITLQLADRSIKYPRGVVEDVLIKVDKFIFQADFVILDMEEDHATPLIFGRPFLATVDVKIEVKRGELSMGVEGKRVVFNIFMKTPNPSSEDLYMIEQVVKLQGCQKAVIEVESQKGKKPSLPKKKNTKKKAKFKKRFMEYIWRVKK
ncbi:uncharacterized protein [Henckelia pumila]|uniref:uncharacterized protein n=1 Tax=Henckelia pumila TaxID=405737 RepID=UPI003C6DD1D8